MGGDRLLENFGSLVMWGAGSCCRCKNEEAPFRLANCHLRPLRINSTSTSQSPASSTISGGQPQQIGSVAEIGIHIILFGKGSTWLPFPPLSKLRMELAMNNHHIYLVKPYCLKPVTSFNLLVLGKHSVSVTSQNHNWERPTRSPSHVVESQSISTSWL